MVIILLRREGRAGDVYENPVEGGTGKDVGSDQGGLRKGSDVGQKRRWSHLKDYRPRGGKKYSQNQGLRDHLSKSKTSETVLKSKSGLWPRNNHSHIEKRTAKEKLHCPRHRPKKAKRGGKRTVERSEGKYKRRPKQSLRAR